MPWTLYRYILTEVLKILAVSSAVIVAAISFASAIKFANEGLLDPLRLIKFVLLVAPTFLAFIIPFCSAFASTLVFHRMASENEVLACSASGLSYRAILFPVAFLGVTLTLTLFFMSNWVIPRFHLYSARVVQQELPDVIVSQVKAGRPVEIEKMLIYADAAEVPPLSEELRQLSIPPTKAIVLKGVAVGKLDRQNHMVADGTAERADVLLFDVNEETWVGVLLTNVTIYDPVDEKFAREKRMIIKPVQIPNQFKEKPEFQTMEDLNAWRDRPEEYDRVRDTKLRLVQRIAAVRLIDLIESKQDGQGITFELQGPLENERFIISAPQVKRQGQMLILEGTQQEPVRVRKTASALQRTIEAPRAVVTVDSTRGVGEPEVQVRLREATIIDFAGQSTEHSNYDVPGPLVGSSIRRTLQQNNSALQLLDFARSDATLASVPEVKKAANRLDYNIQKTSREIEYHLHMRAALATCCLFTLMLGAVMSMKMRHSLPLVVYFWTFLLTIVALIITHSGKNLMTDRAYDLRAGLVVVWLGASLLGAVVMGIYWKLIKN